MPRLDLSAADRTQTLLQLGLKQDQIIGKEDLNVWFFHKLDIIRIEQIVTKNSWKKSYFSRLYVWLEFSWVFEIFKSPEKSRINKRRIWQFGRVGRFNGGVIKKKIKHPNVCWSFFTCIV